MELIKQLDACEGVTTPEHKWSETQHKHLPAAADHSGHHHSELDLRRPQILPVYNKLAKPCPALVLQPAKCGQSWSNITLEMSHIDMYVKLVMDLQHCNMKRNAKGTGHARLELSR